MTFEGNLHQLSFSPNQRVASQNQESLVLASQQEAWNEISNSNVRFWGLGQYPRAMDIRASVPF